MRQRTHERRTRRSPQRRKPDHRRAARQARARCARSGNAFPNDFRRDALAGDLHAAYGDRPNEALERDGDPRSRVAGRMMLKRVMGKASFATLQDMSGTHPALRHARRRRARTRTTRSSTGTSATSSAPTGTLFKTKTGELSVKCDDAAPAREVAAPAAGEIPRPDRPGAALPPALRRPDHQPGVARRVRRRARRSCRRSASSSSRAATSKSRRR